MILVDLAALRAPDTDALLDLCCKAHSEAGPDPWRPHENPWLTEPVERFTRMGDRILAGLQQEWSRLAADLATLREAPPLLKAAAWDRWSATEIADHARQLARIPPEQRGPSEWMTLVELIIQQFLPDGVITSAADYLATISTLGGMLRAHWTDAPPVPPADLSRLLPESLRDIPAAALTPRRVFTLRAAATDAANAIRDLSDRVRGKIRGLVAHHVRRATLGDRSPGPTLEQDLLDTAGTLNRDWRRIAITEAGNAAEQGFIASLPPGSRVRREEAYADACPFCESIRGRELTVVRDDHEPKDWDREVWPSKTNLGRSASPRKRADEGLVLRPPDELWSIPAGLVHPHCRGSWTLIPPTPLNVDPAFDQWARALLAQTAPRPPVRR